MANTILGANFDLSSEIEQALPSLGKHGYTASANETPHGTSVVFTFGENAQVLNFTKDQIQKSGAIAASIVEHLGYLGGL